MRVLVVGSGGREHALCWAIAASPLLTKLWCAPGNPGIAALAECVSIGATDLAALVAFAQDNEVDLVVPGPEAPLVAGITDAMEAAGIPCVGPSRAAAQLEGSKAFTKELCDAAGIPTAQWERFDDADAAREFVRRRGAPIVVKADGLAAGKGVVVAATEAEALAAIDAMMDARAFGEAGASVVIEECLIGEEISLFALCDGESALLLGSAQDHKRVGDGDTGPNTGGMGSYSPTPACPPALEDAAMGGIVVPALEEMARRGTPFRGILYAGLMVTDDGVKLIEFNVRFGDPECQPLLMRLQSDLVDLLEGVVDDRLVTVAPPQWDPRPAVCVVMASAGYPGDYERGLPIRGLDEAAKVPDVKVFHSGTATADGKVVTNGGRVLAITALGNSIPAAKLSAYTAVKQIRWEGAWCRKDISDKAQRYNNS
jgi:phosphoribosylamine---glycine ligase